MAHLEPNAWDRAVAVNMTANYRLIRALDTLLRSAEAGRAIFVTTGLAKNPRAFWGPYAATKAGLESMVGCYAQEVEHTAVRCVLLEPGPMRTRLRAAAYPGEDPDALTPPDAIAPLVVELARGDVVPPTQTVSFSAWAQGAASISA